MPGIRRSKKDRTIFSGRIPQRWTMKALALHNRKDELDDPACSAGQQHTNTVPLIRLRSGIQFPLKTFPWPEIPVHYGTEEACEAALEKARSPPFCVSI